jgi:hypothetical protein
MFVSGPLCRHLTAIDQAEREHEHIVSRVCFGDADAYMYKYVVPQAVTRSGDLLPEALVRF